MFRHLSILTICLALIALDGPAGRAQKEAGRAGVSKLEGAWRMVGTRAAEGQEYAKLPEGMEHIKLVTGGRFVWTTVQEGKILRSAGGKYTVEGDKYREFLEHVYGPDVERFAGKEAVFTWKIEGGKWYHKGVIKSEQGDFPIDEIWERVNK